MKKKNRKHSIIDSLPSDLREAGDEIEYNLHQRKVNVFIEIAGRKHKITLPAVRI